MYAANALPMDSIEQAAETHKQQDSESKRVSAIYIHFPDPERFFYVNFGIRLIHFLLSA